MRNTPIRLAALVLAAGLLLLSYAIAEAAATRPDSKPTPSQDRSIDYGRQAIEKEEWAKAVKHFDRAVMANAENADAYNLLAYSYRRMGKLDPAFENYEKALALDPKHRGAHEYIGEAYLMIGEPEKAEEHLAILSEICGEDCEETATLRKAITRYKESGDKQATIGADDDLW